jgi:NADH:ubiquinone oxidoreductase subunit E
MVQSHQIIICMGSSCFSRGNKSLYNSIISFLKNHNLEPLVSVKGSLCECNCKTGPNIKIDGQDYHSVTEQKLLQILQLHLLNSA